MADPSEVTFGQLLYSSIAFMLLAAGAIVVFFTTYQRRLLQQQLLLQQAETQHQQQLLAAQQQLLLAVIEAQETERERIGQDLHDGLGSAMATAKLLVTRLGSQPAPENPASLFQLLEELMGNMVHEVRSISHSLYPAVLTHFGLGEALRHLVATCNETGKLPISLQLAYHEALDLEQELALYRICQELLTNAFKHATGATQLLVQLRQQPTQLALVVEDNGCGLPPGPASSPASQGAGLRSIAARVQLLRGQLHQLRPATGPGTRTIIEIPL
jgi:signal transduction histidine kinase